MMQNQPTPLPFDFNYFDFDYEPASAETIDIPDTQMDEAARLSQTLINPEQQWQTYLDAIALFGLEQWLLERAPDLTFVTADCSLFHPPTANLIAAVCQLKVGQFKLCLLTTSHLTDEQIQIPKAVVDLPAFAADFYVVVEVSEEAEQAKIDRYLRSDQLQAQVNIQINTQVEAQTDTQSQFFDPFTASDCFYSLNRDRFSPNSDTLLLELRCLNPTAIPPFSLSSPVLLPLAQLQDSLMQKLSLLAPHSDRTNFSPASPILSWTELATLLQSPDLVNWWDEAQRSLQKQSLENQQSPSTQPSILAHYRQKLTTIVDRLSSLSQHTCQAAINVACWLDNRLDETAQSLAWMLLPPIVPAMTQLRGMRSSAEQLNTVLTELVQQGVAIQPHVRAAYQDLQLADLALRLYAVTWQLSPQQTEPHPDPEWTLLLILGTQPGMSLPLGSQLQIQDETQVLVKQVLTASKDNTEENYLFARVIGNWSEQFSATVSLPDGSAIALPPFTFDAQPT